MDSLRGGSRQYLVLIIVLMKFINWLLRRQTAVIIIMMSLCLEWSMIKMIVMVKWKWTITGAEIWSRWSGWNITLLWPNENRLFSKTRRLSLICRLMLKIWQIVIFANFCKFDAKFVNESNCASKRLASIVPFYCIQKLKIVTGTMLCSAQQ